MQATLSFSAVFAGLLGAAIAFTAPAEAQEVVHALSGTVTSIDAQAKNIVLKTNDGSEGTFAFPTSANTEMDFDRGVQGRTTPISKFNKTGESVVLFYYGDVNGTRTAVAVEDLGSGPFDMVEGTVTGFNRRQRKLSIKTAAGAEQTFTLDPKAMADTATGAVSGDHFEPSKGDSVRVIATKGSGGESALFVRD